MEDFAENYLPQKDSRSLYANAVCKLVYEKYQGDLNECLTKGNAILENLNNDVVLRNLYEVCDEQVPLLAYKNLIEEREDNFDSEEDYQKAIESAAKYCKMFYGTDFLTKNLK